MQKGTQATAGTRSRKVGHPVLLTGLLFGVGLGCIEVVLIIVANLTQAELANMALIVVALVAFLLAGWQASAQTGLLSSGAYAGLLTGIISAIILFVGNMIFTNTHVEQLRQIYQAASDNAIVTQTYQGVVQQYQYTDGVIIEVAVIAGVVSVILSFFAGLGLGVVGGYLGSKRYHYS